MHKRGVDLCPQAFNTSLSRWATCMYVENDLVAPTAGLPLPVRHRVLYSTKDVKGATM